MADRNILCSEPNCDLPVSAFGFTRTGSKVYVCRSHVTTLLDKRISIFDIESEPIVQSVADGPEYERRRGLKEQGLGVVGALEVRCDRDLADAEGGLLREEERLMRVLQESLGEVKSKLQRRYQEIKKALIQSKENFERLTQDRNFDLCATDLAICDVSRDSSMFHLIFKDCTSALAKLVVDSGNLLPLEGNLLAAVTDKTKTTPKLDDFGRNQSKIGKLSVVRSGEEQGNAQDHDDQEGWTCDYCTLINNESDRICNACAKTRKEQLPPKLDKDLPKPASKTQKHQPDSRKKVRKEAQADQKEAKTADTWRCEKCLVEVQGSRSYCNSCYSLKPAPGSRGQETPKVNTQEEDWKCGSCQHINRPTREVCLICRVPRVKVEQAASLSQEARALAKGDAADRAFMIDVQEEAEPQANVKSSYWNCSACTAMNLPMDKDCYRCHNPKSALEPGPAEPKPRSTYYWMCRDCGAQNFKEDVKCYHCKQAKEGKRQETSTEGTWICEYCQGINGEREYCSKCFKNKKQQTTEKPVADRKGQLCADARKGTSEPRTMTCSNCGQPTTKKNSQLCPTCEEPFS